MEKKNNLDPQYNKLLEDILENGIKKQTRNGEVMSVFGRQIKHKMSDGFPLLTGKKMFFKGIVTELIWFLRGDTNIKFLVDNGCNIWNGDAYKNYLIKTKNQIEDPNDLNWDLSSPKDPKITQLTQEQFINKIKTDDEFAKKWGDLGKIYGAQWRRWTKKKMYLSTDGSYEKIYDEMDQTVIDQIAILINDLKTNPDSRRLMVSAWNVGELDQMVLPPCHFSWQVYTRKLSQEELRSRYPKLKEVYDMKQTYIKNMEYENSAKARDIEKQIIETLPTRAISLMWNQRSVDTGLGLGFNIASYGLLLEIIAKQVNMIPDELIGNLGDVHLYKDHIEPIKEQLNRKPFELPILKIYGNVDDISHYEVSNFELIGYQSHPTIKLPLSN